jgi:hypothetical protein
MGISDRTEDAVFLWQQGRRESALLLACVAVAARARSKYPQEKDREGFVHLLQDARLPRVRVEFRGELQDELVHNAAIPVDILIDDELGDGLSLRAGGAPEYVLKLSPGWFGFPSLRCEPKDSVN